jgi:uncharacterized protein (DUF305 family)
LSREREFDIHAHVGPQSVRTTLSIVDAERTFLTLMIKHHQGGVTMATNALPNMTRPEVKRIAQSIITSQTSEINALTELRNKRTAGLA